MNTMYMMLSMMYGIVCSKEGFLVAQKAFFAALVANVSKWSALDPLV